MAPEVLLVQCRPIMRLLLLLCRPRAEIDQCDAGLIHVLHHAITLSCIMCHMGMLGLLAYNNCGHLSTNKEREMKVTTYHAHISVRATDRGKFAAAADADIIDVIVQVWQQSQVFRGCLAASLCTLQADF